MSYPSYPQQVMYPPQQGTEFPYRAVYPQPQIKPYNSPSSQYPPAPSRGMQPQGNTYLQPQANPYAKHQQGNPYPNFDRQYPPAPARCSQVKYLPPQGNPYANPHVQDNRHGQYPAVANQNTFQMNTKEALKLNYDVTSNRTPNPNLITQRRASYPPYMCQPKQPLIKERAPVTLPRSIKPVKAITPFMDMTQIEKALYGPEGKEDRRRNIDEETDTIIQQNALCVVSLWQKQDVHIMGNTAHLNVTTFQSAPNEQHIWKPLDTASKFYGDPLGAFGTGFLLRRKSGDYIITAGHCVADERATNTYFIFGWRSGKKSVETSKVFEAEYVSHSVGELDYGIVKLKRRLPHKYPSVTLRKWGTVTKEELYVIGHPYGLDMKIADGAHVIRNVPYEMEFMATLDTFCGNSGSPVFNKVTHQVEGILVKGRDDYKMNEDTQMMVAVTYGEHPEEAERVTRIDLIRKVFKHLSL